MKIALKLTNPEITVALRFTELSFNSELQKGDIYDRMVYCNLSEFLLKLKMASVFAKDKYSIRMSAASGLAFIAHCRENMNVIEVSEEHAALINRIISVIDQKTC
jgi:hypothetical protein